MLSLSVSFSVAHAAEAWSEVEDFSDKGVNLQKGILADAFFRRVQLLPKRHTINEPTTPPSSRAA